MNRLRKNKFASPPICRVSATRSFCKRPALLALVFSLGVSILLPIHIRAADALIPYYLQPVEGQFEQSTVNGVSGAFNYSIPVTIPPGRNGVQPNLQLTYSNQSNEHSNLLGFGWDISIPYIERVRKTNVESIYAQSFFTSSLSGELATTSTSGVFFAKSDDGSYITYTFSTSTNKWTATDTTGRVYSFGHASTTRQDNPGNANQVYRWMLEEERDANYNRVTYEYFKDSGFIYPSKITYTGTATTTGLFTIDFNRELRSDPATTTDKGFTSVSKYRINQIVVSVNGNWERKYDLAYTAGDNGLHSVLDSVTESGRTLDNASSTVTLPPIEFGYQAFSDGFSTTTTEFSIPEKIALGTPGHETGTRFFDVNGDSLVDIVRAQVGTTTRIYINDGDGWNATTTWSFPEPFVDASGADVGTRLADVNGDGLIDVVRHGETVSKIHIHTGLGWATSTRETPEAFLDNGQDFGSRLADVNGDGLVDFLRSYYTGSGGWEVNRIYINDGINWTLSSSTLPTIFAREFFSAVETHGTLIDDVNGDGLADFITQDNDQSQLNGVYINAGTNWNKESSFSIPHNGDLAQEQLADVNGDGIPDFVDGSDDPDDYVYLGNGKTWVLDTSWVLPVSALGGMSQMMDITGDGLADVIRSGDAYNDRWINQAKPADRITSIVSAQGATTNITYKNSPQYITGGVVLNPELPFSVQTVESIAVGDGFGNTMTTTYQYEGGDYNFLHLFERAFAGFGLVKSTDSVGNVTKRYFHQGNTSATTTGEYNDLRSKIGKPYRTETYDNASNLYALEINKWDHADRSGESDFVKLASTTILAYDGDADHRDTAQSLLYNNGSGALFQRIEFGEVTGNTNGSFTDTGTDKFTTTFTYATSTATSTVFSLSQETTLDNSSSKVREKKIYYDGLSFGQRTKGNSTKVEQWKTSSSYASTTQAYNMFGLIASSTDARGKITTYAYDSLNLYPATTTNPLSQTIARTYDYSSGKVRVTTDPNARKFETIYDALDRPIVERQPDISTPSTLVDKKTYAYTDIIGSRKVLETSYLSSTTSAVVYTYLDGLDRKIQTRKEGEAFYSVRDSVYDSRGLLQKESLPYFYSGIQRTDPTTNGALYTQYTYDPLKRVTQTSTVVGATTNTYDQWAATTTDALGKAKGVSKDAYENLVSVTEKNGSSYYTTAYQYDGNKNLKKITDADGNVRNFTYDGLGRRLTAQDVHDAADGTYGTWTYTYDDAGNVTSQVDPKSQTVNFTYDNTNRVLTENYTGTGGTEMQYAYDTCTEGATRLCTATSTGAVTKFTYNALGLVATEARTINNGVSSTTYTTASSYDRLGNITSLVYPDSSEVRYSYNTAGLLETIEQKENGGSFAYIISALDYAPTEKVSHKEFGNDVITTYTYDADKLYRLTNIFSVVDTGEGEGGGGAFAEDPWSTLALAVERLPLAMQTILLDEEDIAETVSSDQASSSTEDSMEALGTATSAEEVSTSPSEQEEAASTTDSVSETVFEPANGAISTPSIFPESVSATSTEPLEEEKSKKLPVDAPELAFKAPLEKHLGKKEFTDGVVKYAYKTDVSVEAVPASVATVEKAKGQGLSVTGEMLEERSAHARTFRTNVPHVFITEIISGDPQYFKDEVGAWWIADYATTTKESYDYQEKEAKKPKNIVSMISAWFADLIAFVVRPVFADESTFYPDSHPETSTVDGRTFNRIDPSWSVTRSSSASSQAGDNEVEVHFGTAGKGYYSGNYDIGRTYFLFDTSSIPDTHAISSSTLSVYVRDRVNTANDGYDFLVVTQSSPASNTAIVTDDFDQASFSPEGSNRIDLTGVSNGAYIHFALNETGRSWITQTGVSKFSILEGHDVLNVAPGDSERSNGNFSGAEETGTAQDPKLIVVHSTDNLAPLSAGVPLVEGVTNAVNITDTTPEFSAVFSDPNPGDIATEYRINVATTSDFSSIFWDSNRETLSSSTPSSMRSPDISYSGFSLTASTTYYWRFKFYDVTGAEGAWSTTTSSFSLSSTTTPAPPTGSVIQNISYTYDAVGNITQITDHSDTGAAKTVSFNYDDLYRLTTASTTAASSTPFRETYAVSAIGNITGWKQNTSATTTYTYGETSYTNPHAPTAIGGSLLTYDTNGNLTVYGTKLYQWDYRNRLATSSPNGTASTTYAYDHTNQRVKKTSGGTITSYPNKFYDTDGTTITKHIFAGDELIATVTGTEGGGESLMGGGNGGGETSVLKDPFETFSLLTAASPLALSVLGDDASLSQNPTTTTDISTPETVEEFAEPEVPLQPGEPLEPTQPLSPKQTSLTTDGLVKSEEDARMWREYHKERVAYLSERKDLPPEALESALHGQDKFERYLLEKGYIAEKGGAVGPLKQSFFDTLGNIARSMLKQVLALFLPQTAYAFLFGKEDFESCGALPCSFTYDGSWGGITPSLDHGSMVVGEDSLKEVVSGEGGGSQVKTGLAESELYVQFKVYIPDPYSFGASGYAGLLTLADSSGNPKVWINVENYGNPRLVIDGNTLAYTDTSLNLTKGAVNTIELRVKIDSSAGDVDLWLNNSTEGSPSYNGSGSLNTGTGTIGNVYAGLTYVPESGYSTTYHDDYIFDTAFIGEEETGGPTIEYIHTDHLGGTNVVTDQNANTVQVVDYYPFGDERISSGSNSTDRHFIGERYDEESDLNYLNARYYDGDRGQFTSQDPIFKSMGDPRQIAQLGHDMRKILTDPQQMNSYSYARNNPIIYKDPEGELGVLALFAVGALANVAHQGLQDMISGNTPQWQNYVGAAVGGVAGTAAFLSTGSNPFAVGAVTAGTEEYASQWLGAATSDGGQGINYGSVALESGAGGVFGKIGLPGLKNVTSGRNSMQGITNQIGTKLSNGTIQNFTTGTASKILTTQFITGSPQAIIMGGVSSQSFSNQLSAIRKTLESISKTISSLQNKK